MQDMAEEIQGNLQAQYLYKKKKKRQKTKPLKREIRKTQNKPKDSRIST